MFQVALTSAGVRVAWALWLLGPGRHSVPCSPCSSPQLPQGARDGDTESHFRATPSVPHQSRVSHLQDLLSCQCMRVKLSQPQPLTASGDRVVTSVLGPDPCHPPGLRGPGRWETGCGVRPRELGHWLPRRPGQL